MSAIRPLRALRYDAARVELSRVLVPPYDVVAAHERERFFDLDPHNAIHLELTRRVEDEAGADYAEVRKTLDAWRRDGVLRLDPEASLYALRQQYRAPDGGTGSRDGFFALLRLEDYEAKIVRPHERTLSGPKADRLKLLRASQANLSPVFFLYEDPDDQLGAPLRRVFETEQGDTARDSGGVEQRLVPVAEASFHAECADFLAKRPVVIADGHHRYETALKYRDECRARRGFDPDAPEEFLLAYFANAYDAGTRLLPIHRVVLAADHALSGDLAEQIAASLSGWQVEAQTIDDPARLDDWLGENLAPKADRHAFAFDDGSGAAFIVSRERRDGDPLSIRVIHQEVLGGLFALSDDAVREGAVAFPKSAAETARMVRSGEGVAALYLNPLRPAEVFEVTGAGEVLPQKSTFFYPKLPSGLLFRLFDRDPTS